MNAENRFEQTDFIDPEIREMQNTVNAQVLQLQITLRSLEQRLEKSYAAQRQMKAQLDGLKTKINRFKSMIPFGNHLSNWASSYLVGGRKR